MYEERGAFGGEPLLVGTAQNDRALNSSAPRDPAIPSEGEGWLFGRPDPSCHQGPKNTRIASKGAMPKHGPTWENQKVNRSIQFLQRSVFQSSKQED